MLASTPPLTTYQEEPLATLELDYGQAVIHLAWDVHKDTKRRTILFALVELLPCEVPPPEDYGEQTIRLGSKEHRLFVRHIILPASQALAWYRGCAQGAGVRPDQQGNFVGSSRPQDLFVDLGWDEEPTWPNLTCALPTLAIPFLSRWQYPPRVHHLIATNFSIAAHWPQANDRDEAAKWLHEQLGFDLCERASLFGSIHLVAPNPVFRNFHYNRGKLLTAGLETVCFKFDLRGGQRPYALTLIIRDDTATGTGLLKCLQINNASDVFVINRKFDLQSIYVIDRYRGVLYGCESFYFPGGFSMNMQLVTSRRVVRDDAGRIVSKVPLIGEGGPVIETNAPGQESVRPRQAAAALRAESNLWRRRQKAQRSSERWFQGDKAAAVKLIRNLLRGAGKRVLIVDPYFRKSELKFILEVSNTRVPIRVLSSARALKKIEIDNCSPRIGRIRNVLGAFGIKRDQLVPILKKLLSATEMLPADLGVRLKKTECSSMSHPSSTLKSKLSK